MAAMRRLYVCQCMNPVLLLFVVFCPPFSSQLLILGLLKEEDEASGPSSETTRRIKPLKLRKKKDHSLPKEVEEEEFGGLEEAALHSASDLYNFPSQVTERGGSG